MFKAFIFLNNLNLKRHMLVSGICVGFDMVVDGFCSLLRILFRYSYRDIFLFL